MTPLQTFAFALADVLRGRSADPAIQQARDAARMRRQEAARAQLAAWRSRPVAPQTWVQQAEFAERLLALVQRPFLMQQAGFATCGPVACWSALLHDYPDDVVRFATTLFETGTARMGNAQLTVSGAVRACAKQDIERECAAVNHPAPPGTDWLLFSVVQSSFQTSYKGLPAGVAAVPQRARNFLGSTGLYANVDIPGTGSKLDERLAGKRPNDDRVILLFLNSSLINNKEQDIFPTPQHIVYLDAVQPYDDDGDAWAVFTMYSWGERLIQSHEVSALFAGVRGYVSAERSY